MKKILSNTWLILDKKEKKQFTTHVIAGTLISIADILSLAALLWIIKFYIDTTNNTSISFLPGWLTDKDSVYPVAIFFILFSIKNIAGYYITKAQFDFTGKVAVRISETNLANYQRSAFKNFVDTDSSSHIRTIALEPFEFSQHVLSGLQQIITQLMLIIFAILAIIIFNAKLFLLLMIILLPPVIIVFFLIKKRMEQAKKQIRNSNERSYQYLLDALKGYVESNIFQRNHFFLSRFTDQRRQFSKYLFQSLSLQNLPARIIEIFAVLGLFILIVIAKWSGNDNANTFITIGAFMAAAYKIIPGIVKIINLGGQLKAYEFSTEEFQQNPDSEKNSPVDLKVTEINSLEVKHLHFQFADQVLLNDISFSLNRNDFLGISGVSGKGKTTLINILLGFLSPSSGEVVFNNQIVNSEAIKKLWPSVSYVRQQSFFIYDTILRNITLEEKDADQDRLAFALKLSGLDKLIETFPEGLEKILTENGKNISGGQQQRIALARAIYKISDLIFLDEPFNELDDEAVSQILEQLKELAATGKIIIMITHDKQSLLFCNKTISLDEQQY
jgi:ABC-type bacteriocin/lantibiotic exporter with double-glycine peptidase domain